MKSLLDMEPEIQDSLSACHTALERQIWAIIATRDVVNALDGRAPTKAESDMLARYGIHVTRTTRNDA